MSRRRALLVGLLALVLVVPADGVVHAAPPPADTFHGVVPARVLDTRVGGTTVDHVSEGGGAVGPASVRNVTILNRGGVPASGVGAVALNVTAIGTTSSFVTVWPAGASQPNASNLNLLPGVAIPNMVIVPLGAEGQVSLYNDSGNTQLLVDVLGWFPTGDSFTGLVPARLMDTRIGGQTIDAVSAGGGPVGPESVTNLTILGRGGVPLTGVDSVALNVTATSPSSNSFVTVWPTGAPRPNASNLNLRAGVTTPNMVIVAVGPSGQISLFNESGTTNLLVDVLGWFPDGDSFGRLVPARLMDTRNPGGATFDGLFAAGGVIGPGVTTNLTVVNRGGVPPVGAGAVALNVTAVGPTANSFVTVWPAGAAQPNASNLNLQAGVTTPNMVIVALGAGGQISLFNESGSTNLLVDVLGWFPSTTAGASTIRASVQTGGEEAAGGSTAPSVSADGRYTVYQSTSTDLLGAGNDTNGTGDIFLFDRDTVTTTRVSVSSVNGEANGESTNPMISANGRYVVFETTADNIGNTTDNNGAKDIYVRDLQLFTTIRVSVGAASLQANGASSQPSISADGQFISFLSSATNLVGALDTNGRPDVFVHDRVGLVTTRVSLSTAGDQGDFQADRPMISGDGRYVAFSSFATNLVAGDNNNNYDIFVRDRTLSVTTRVSVSSAGVESSGGSLENAISSDGRFVVFTSPATDLVVDDTNANYDIFRHDSVTGTTVRVSLASGGVQVDEDSDFPSISADGRYILFETSASFVPGDTNTNNDVFVHDIVDGTTERVGVSTAGTESAFGTAGSAISANGRFVVFYTSGGDLVPSDTNAFNDVFLRDRGTI